MTNRGPLVIDGNGNAAIISSSDTLAIPGSATASSLTLTTALQPAYVAGVFNHCRIYLSNGAPYTDNSSANLVYFGPCADRGQFLTLDNGSGVLSTYTVSQINVSLLSGFSTTTIYDLYIYNNSGTLTLDSAAWSGNTPPSRSTDAAGRLTKNGATNELWVGTVYVVSGASNDNTGSRYVWNTYNRIQKPLLAQISSVSSHTYNSTAVHAVNSNTTNGQGCVQVVTGGQIEAIALNTFVSAYFSTTGGVEIGIGIDSTSSYTVAAVTSTAGSTQTSLSCSLTQTQIGSHVYQRLENCSTTGTGTFFDQGAGAMYGTTWC